VARVEPTGDPLYPYKVVEDDGTYVESFRDRRDAEAHRRAVDRGRGTDITGGL
jgi:hypothetical protein